jgi:hypothetical protein
LVSEDIDLVRATHLEERMLMNLVLFAFTAEIEVFTDSALVTGPDDFFSAAIAIDKKV